MQKVCRCKRGYASAYDGKCGYCRSKRERNEHRRLLRAAERERERERYAAVARQASIATPADFPDLTKEAQHD